MQCARRPSCVGRAAAHAQRRHIYGAWVSPVGGRSARRRRRAVRTARLAAGATSVDTTEPLTIIHFSDVYEISSNNEEPVGGAARFCKAVKDVKGDPLILFSGDCLNPSTLSAFTKGSHMPPVFNHIGVHVGCLGNHDFDFGSEELMLRMKEFGFPWLLSNVLDKRTGGQLANAEEYIEMEWSGHRLGIIGLVEQEWLMTIPSIDVDEDVVYVDFVDKGRELCSKLKANGCDMIIALTHMRGPNDEKLAMEVPDIHLILGGHDHSPQADFVPPHGTLLLKSGTDFREFSVLKLSKRGTGEGGVECTDVAEPTTNETDSEIDFCSAARDDVVVSWKRVYVTSETEEDEEIADIVEDYHQMMGEEILSPLGWTLVDLDARFDHVRNSETSLGNLLADIMRLGIGKNIDVDGALLNSGTIRSDRIHASGQLTVKDLITMLPFTDELVVLSMTGDAIMEAVEIAVSAWPAKEGRFLQVSGISYAFDPIASPGQRIVPGSVTVGGAPLEPSRKYTIATKAYLRSGKDGFGMLKDAEEVVDPETAPRLVTLIHALLSRVQTLNECLDANGSDSSAPCANSCSVLRGTKLESLIAYDEATNRYGLRPVVEDRIRQESVVYE